MIVLSLLFQHDRKIIPVVGSVTVLYILLYRILSYIIYTYHTDYSKQCLASSRFAHRRFTRTFCGHVTMSPLCLCVLNHMIYYIIHIITSWYYILYHYIDAIIYDTHIVLHHVYYISHGLVSSSPNRSILSTTIHWNYIPIRASTIAAIQASC